MRAYYVLLVVGAALLASGNTASAVPTAGLTEMAQNGLMESVDDHVAGNGNRFLRIRKVEDDDDDSDIEAGATATSNDDDDNDDDNDDDIETNNEERAMPLFSSAKIKQLMKPDETYLYQKMASWKSKKYSPSDIWNRLNLDKYPQYNKIYEKYLVY
ncbi:hypothetical protein PHYBOEH_011270 [Phytophthora boehmeriae]|uniref:RxLR effector protein n=1 Tax=Phytophthora boehmeriae TaxID=109152 RepID=A0A8T1WW58_9STRA|nr:hypothetical protein PHYBOEH_011270 [Phytophthora boehmeriae]